MRRCLYYEAEQRSVEWDSWQQRFEKFTFNWERCCGTKC